jgi:hypothetical protein
MKTTLRTDPNAQWLEPALMFRTRCDRDDKRFKFRDATSLSLSPQDPETDAARIAFSVPKMPKQDGRD